MLYLHTAVVESLEALAAFVEMVNATAANEGDRQPDNSADDQGMVERSADSIRDILTFTDSHTRNV